jgi:hypothetical protein
MYLRRSTTSWNKKQWN